MPLKEDYVHDAVMHIRQAIAYLKNPTNVFRHEKDADCVFTIAKESIRKAETNDPLVVNFLGIRNLNEEHIPYLKLAIERLHESIGYNPTPNNPNQLTINFNGEQNPDNQN